MSAVVRSALDDRSAGNSPKMTPVSSETTTFYDNSTITAVSTQKCKAKPAKK